MRRAPAVLFPLLLVALAAPVWAQDADDTGQEAEAEEEAVEEGEALGKPLAERIPAVTSHFFLKRNRFALVPAFGVGVNDAYFRDYQLQLDLSYSVMEQLSVDLRLNGTVYSEPLAIVSFIEQNNLDFSGLKRPLAFISLAATFTPIYGKNAVLSEFIWHYDVYISAGGGLALYGLLNSANQDVGNLAPAPAGFLGIGTRAFLSQWMAVNLDARNYLAFPIEANPEIRNYTLLSVGVSIWFPFAFERETQVFGVSS